MPVPPSVCKFLVLSVTVAAGADVALSGPATHAATPDQSAAAKPSAVAKAKPQAHSTRFKPTVADPTTATPRQLARGARSAWRSNRFHIRRLDAPGITRGTVMARAQSWITEGVPYNRYAYNTDDNGTYRQDCSGFVSMAWHLPSSSANNYGETTGTLPNFATELNSLDDLRPGDMLDNISTHVVLFKGWADSSHTTAMILEEAHAGTNAREDGRFYTRRYLATRGYRPYRYNGIQETPDPDSPQSATADSDNSGDEADHDRTAD
ncbi:hypothetical protein [Streptantibioticus ferralitis]|uniref:NlpC/P60 domain-containing protein n=1 Tax=Streptantibioticus ferralitis TaxID=236510 RepID=A0ABT5YW67_9ACTN|nr:hypothetical protein [Streptantibioticus ferralitis]MDF2255833.1 hypothetical protein [Streptantibioticus ferralitis]